MRYLFLFEDFNTDVSIVDYLAAQGKANDKPSRLKLANQLGIKDYNYTGAKNTELLNKLKEVDLKKAAINLKITTEDKDFFLNKANIQLVQKKLMETKDKNGVNFLPDKNASGKSTDDGILTKQTIDAINRYLYPETAKVSSKTSTSTQTTKQTTTKQTTESKFPKQLTDIEGIRKSSSGDIIELYYKIGNDEWCCKFDKTRFTTWMKSKEWKKVADGSWICNMKGEIILTYDKVQNPPTLINTKTKEEFNLTKPYTFAWWNSKKKVIQPIRPGDTGDMPDMPPWF